MSESIVSIVDLPDEILVYILNKLNRSDVLYSLVDVKGKLDRLARDIRFSQSINLLTIEPNGMSDSRNNPIVNRFCWEILPRLHDKVESVTVQGWILPRILCAANYLYLRKIVVVNLELRMGNYIFHEKSPYIRDLRQQITDLTLNINDGLVDSSNVQFLNNIHKNIFELFPNLKCLDINGYDICNLSRLLINDFSSKICYSSSIVNLRIKMQNIDDCINLLDGRISQLHTLIIDLEFIHNPKLISLHGFNIIRNSLRLMNNVANPLGLKCFSLHVFVATSEFDSLMVPLLQRMGNLEKLSLSLRVHGQNSFIDGTYLNNNILSTMSYLHTFEFDIVTDYVEYNVGQNRPTVDDIRRTFVERGYDVNCYIDYYDFSNLGRCHVYSLPFNMNYVHFITPSFPGDMFINVRVLYLKDVLYRPFEHKFFALISCSFPFLNRLTIWNLGSPRENNEKRCSIINFSHLVELAFHAIHIDYVEQFLSSSKTCLPCLNKIYISYKDLVTVTQNFTRNTTRMNCAKLKQITFDRKIPTMIHSKDYYRYFPLLL